MVGGAACGGAVHRGTRIVTTHDAVYVYVVPWSEFPIVPSYPHYPHGSRTTLCPDHSPMAIRPTAGSYGLSKKKITADYQAISWKT
jgi:hypothetical protein